MANMDALLNVTSVPPSCDEVAQFLHAFVAQTARVALRNGAGAEAVDDLALGDVGNHDHVVVLAQVAVDDIGVIEAGEGKLELFENPAGPAFVDAGGPRTVEADALRLDGLPASLAATALQMILGEDGSRACALSMPEAATSSPEKATVPLAARISFMARKLALAA